MHDDDRIDWAQTHKEMFGEYDPGQDSGPIDVESQIDWDSIYAEADRVEAEAEDD